MKKKHLTLSEIVIVVVILGVLATIGIPLYNATIENAKAKACELNLKTILGAVEAQTLERDSFPASLSKISDKNFNKAWAKVLKDEGAFKVKLVYFLVNLDENGLVYAAAANNGPWIHKFISDAETLRCPSVQGGNSYGVNSTLAGKTYEEYKAEPEATIVVGDCNSNRFRSVGDLDLRHKEYNFFNATDYALTVDKAHKKLKVKRGGNVEEGEAPGLPGQNNPVRNEPNGPNALRGPNEPQGPNAPHGPSEQRGPNEPNSPNAPHGPSEQRGPNAPHGPSEHETDSHTDNRDH